MISEISASEVEMKVLVICVEEAASLGIQYSYV